MKRRDAFKGLLASAVGFIIPSWSGTFGEEKGWKIEVPGRFPADGSDPRYYTKWMFKHRADAVNFISSLRMLVRDVGEDYRIVSCESGYAKEIEWDRRFRTSKDAWDFIEHFRITPVV